MIKATFALLADTGVHNLVRKLSWEFHQKYQTPTTSLPPHISLKQPFKVSELHMLARYMDDFAHSITPFEVTLSELQVIPMVVDGVEHGILWIDVRETETLRQLHDRINDELNHRFGNTQADFDGRDYHFHMTVMIGGKPIEVYRRFYDEIGEPRIDIRYTPRELAMFVYDEPIWPNGEYLCYKILPIGE